MQGRIGDKTTIVNIYTFLSKAHFYNLSRFRLGAWKLNVNNINLQHITVIEVFVFVITALIKIKILWKMKSM